MKGEYLKIRFYLTISVTMEILAKSLVNFHYEIIIVNDRKHLHSIDALVINHSFIH